MISIRRATLLDANNIQQCNKECLPLSYSTLEYMSILCMNYNIILIAEKENELCGYLYAQHTSNVLHIMSFGIYNKYRRNGIGTKLVSKIEKVAKDHKCNILSLNVHTANIVGIKFYKKNGFKMTKILQNYYQGSLKAKTQDAYRFEKKLP